MSENTIDIELQSDLQSAKSGIISDYGLISSDNEADFSEGDISLVSPTSVIPTNAEQQATRNALTESLLTGKNMSETLPANKMAFETSSPEEIESNSKAKVASILEDGRKANILDMSLSGDSQGVKDSLAVSSEDVNPEDTFVAVIADDSVSPEKMEKHARSLRANNKIHELIARAEQDKVWGFDFLSSIVGQIFLPGHVARIDSEIIANALQDDSIKVSLVAQEKYFNTLKDYYNLLDTQDKDLFLEELYENALESSGTVFDNPEDVKQFFIKFLKYTSSDAALTNIFSTVDLVTYPFAIVTAMAKGIVKTGTSVVANKLANKEIAAKAIAHDILESSAGSGVPTGELVNSALKIGKNPYTYDGQALSGAEENIKQALAEQAASRDVQTLMDMAGPTGIDVSDLANLTAKYTKMYDEVKAPEWQAFSFREADDIGITYRVTAADPKAGGFYTAEHAQKYADRYGMKNTVIEEMDDGMFLLHADYKHKFTIEDASPLSFADNMNQYLPGFLQFALHSLDKKVVTTRVVGMHQEDTARLAFENLWRDSEKGLTAKSSAKVDIMLAKGDDLSKVYTPSELSSYGLSQKEVISYFKKRTIRDVSHAVHNKALADRLTFLGAKEVNYTGEAAEGFKSAGYTMTKEQANAFASSGEQKVVSNVMGSESSTQALTAAGIEEIYKKGGTVVRSLNTLRIGDNSTTVFVARTSDLEVKELTQVLPYRVGEVSRMYTDPYFVSMSFKGMKDGTEATVFNTLKTAKNRKAADAWASGMNKAMNLMREATKKGSQITGSALVKGMSKHVDNPRELMDLVKGGDIPLDAKFQSKFDREIIPGSPAHLDGIIETLFSTGKLFTSQRGERLKRVTGEASPIKTPKEAMAQELSYIARFMNIATWRETQIDTLLKTFEYKIIPLEGATKYETALYGKPISDMSTKEEKYLEVLRNHLKTQLSVPSDAAIKFKKRMDEFAAYMEGKGEAGQYIATKTLGLAHGTITQGLRTLVFHSYLGMGNLAQLFVQANGAFVAVAVSPKYGLIASKNALALRAGVMLDSVQRKDTLKALAKTNAGMEAGLSTPKEFLETIELIRRSGILNGIKSSALHYVKEGAVNLDTHLAAYTGGLSRAIKHTGSQAIKAGLFPFNRGEEFARIVGLDVARREFMKANPGKSFLTRSAINDIVARQEILTLGMSRANTGRMQQGIASIPFQFARYNWNLMESLLGKNFTPAEKARIIGAGTILYGTEGLGLTWLAEEAFGENVNDMTKEQKIGVSEGIMSWGLYKATGAETAIGTRIGWMKYFADNIKGLSRQELSLVAVMSGPSGSFLTKEAEFVNEVYRIFETDGIDLGDKGMLYLHEALKAASVGYSNTTKYAHAYWADGWVKNNSGAKVAKLSNIEIGLSIMGIKSLKEADINKMYDLEGSIRDTKKDLTKGLARLWNMYYTAKASGEDGENEYKQIQAYMQSIPSAVLEDEVFMGAHRILTKDSKFDDKLRKIEQHIRDKKADPSLIPSVRGNK